MKITTALKSYKVKKAEVEVVDARINAHKVLLATNNLSECGYLIDSKPIGSGGGGKSTASPVEREVFGKIDCNRLTAEMIKEWIAEDEARIYMQRIEVEQIEISLKGLTNQERYVVECKYFETMIWRNIEISFNYKFRQRNDITERQIQTIDMIAIRKLSTILKPFYDRYNRLV